MDFELTETDPFESFKLDHYTPQYEAEIYPNILKASNVRSLAIHFRSSKFHIAGLNYVGKVQQNGIIYTISRHLWVLAW